MFCRQSWQFRIFQFCCSIFVWFLAGVRNVSTAPFQNSNMVIKSEIIDPNNTTILEFYNLTNAQMDRIRMHVNSSKKDNGEQREVVLNNVKEFRINDIKHRVESALNFSTNEETQEHPQHEMAAYPICNSDSDEASWLEDNNVTIHFSASLFEQRQNSLNLDSAILRLYKVNPQNPPNSQEIDDIEEDDDNQTKPKRCVDAVLDSQIRVTVSIVQQQRRNKRERRKRICNTIMMNTSKTGWIEIDIKRAIYFWEHAERHEHAQQTRQHIQVGTLIIEVHDEEERPLKPGHYFQPPKCDQADFAIPWNYYGPHTFMSPFEAYEVPRYPRLDVKMIGYASFAPKSYNNKQLHETLRENLLRQIYKSSNKNEAEIDNETTLPSAAPIEPTANNLLSSPIAELEENRQHNHHKRHSTPQNHNCEHNHQDDTQQQHLSIENDNAAANAKKNSMEHSQHRHHKAHNHHHHNHHHNRHHHQHHHRKYEQSPDVV